MAYICMLSTPSSYCSLPPFLPSSFTSDQPNLAHKTFTQKIDSAVPAIDKAMTRTIFTVLVAPRSLKEADPNEGLGDGGALGVLELLNLALWDRDIGGDCRNRGE
jgi:hypothetical protein